MKYKQMLMGLKNIFLIHLYSLGTFAVANNFHVLRYLNSFYCIDLQQ